MAEEIVIFKITGKTPLLMNNPLSMQIGGDGGGGVKKKKIPTPEEEVEKKFYETEDGQLFIPSVAFRAALIEACKFMKIGKYAASRQAKSGVFVVEPECRLYNPTTKKNTPLTRKNAKIFVTRCVVVKSGVMRARPQIDKWGCKLVLEIDDDFINKDQVLDRLKAAGKYPGVLDYRPEKSGSFGRFLADFD